MKRKSNSYAIIEKCNEFSNVLGFNLKKESDKIFNFVLKKLKIKKIFYVEVSIVSNYKIKKINSNFRYINKTTDVLSFPSFNFNKPKNFIGINNYFEPIFLGDIVISIDKIFSQSKKYNHSSYREYSFLFLHSILHLIGFDHTNDRDEKIMISLQNEILDDLGINR